MVSLVSGLGTPGLMPAETSLPWHLPQWLSPRRRSATLVQEVALLTQEERLQRAEQARGALVKTWLEKASPDKKGRDFRGIIAKECLFGVDDLMQVGMFFGFFRDPLSVCLQFNK